MLDNVHLDYDLMNIQMENNNSISDQEDNHKFKIEQERYNDNIGGNHIKFDEIKRNAPYAKHEYKKKKNGKNSNKGTRNSNDN